MKEAKLKSDINRIRIAGEELTVSCYDFALYSNNSIDYTARDAGELFVQVAAGLPLIVVSTPTYNLPLLFPKHKRSTTPENDHVGTYYNTATEDNAAPVWVQVRGAIRHPTGGDYAFSEKFLYCPALYPPNISISRMAAILKNSSNNYGGIFANAQINQHSPSRPDKAAPHRASELIGYSPAFAPYYIDTSYIEQRIEEGASTAVVSTDVLINSGAGITQAVALGVEADVSKSKQTIAKVLAQGTHVFSNSVVINGVTYNLQSTTCNILPAIITITSVSISVDTIAGTITFTVNNTTTDKLLTPVVTMLYKYTVANDPNVYRDEIEAVYAAVSLPANQQRTYTYAYPAPTPEPDGYEVLSVRYELRNSAGNTLVEDMRTM